MYRIYTLNVISNSSCIRKCKLGGKYKKNKGNAKRGVSPCLKI